MNVLQALRRRRPSVVPCEDHRFKEGREFCMVCGIYKRAIPKAKGGYL